MKNVLAVALCFVATAALAAPLAGSVALVQSGVDTFDPGTFLPGTIVDVYEVTVENPNAGDATSLEFAFPGDWVNNQSGGLTFQDSNALPVLGPYTVADTFFVLPTGTSDLAVDIVDDNTMLQASYTVEGEVALVPAGGSVVVAVLSVPTGGEVDAASFVGAAAIGGELEEVLFIPEPSTALLAGLALVGFLARRK